MIRLDTELKLNPGFNLKYLLDVFTIRQPRRPGSKYNLEMVHSCHDALKDLTENTWPGIVDDDPLPLGQGASQATSQHIVVVDCHFEFRECPLAI